MNCASHGSKSVLANASAPGFRSDRATPRFTAPLRAFLCVAFATLASVAVTPLRAAQFTVVSSGDGSDIVPGDGVCAGFPPAMVGNAPADPIPMCTLRAAIEEANALGGADSIVFSATLNGTPVTLGSQLPAVTSQLTITGNGAAATIIEASTCDPVALPGGCTPATWRVFEVGVAGNLSLADLTIRHGNLPGNSDHGGGLLNAGTLDVSGVTFSANVAKYEGGGIENYFAGIIMGISDSTFSGNRAINGAGLYNAGTIDLIADSLFTGNQAEYGGGLEDGGSIGQVRRTAFVGNTATVALGQAFGGGLYANGAITVINACTFDGNAADTYGGGIYAESTNAIGLITGTLFTGNSSAQGGGLLEFDGSMGAVVNSTFSGNTATVDGGAIHIGSGSIAGIVNVTITSNSAPTGAGIFSASSTALPVQNTILGDGKGGGANVVGLVTDSGGNFTSDATPAGAAAIVPGTDYSLTLASNGGPTKTHALLAGSVAIDATGACPSALHAVDQRGGPRDTQCDSGAYEYDFLFADGFESK